MDAVSGKCLLGRSSRPFQRHRKLESPRLTTKARQFPNPRARPPMGFVVTSRPQMVALQLRRGQVVHHPTTTRLPEYIHPAREFQQSASWGPQYPRPMQTYHPEGESSAGAHWTTTWEDKNKVYAPYPKWVTLLARGVFAVFELAVVAYLVHFWRGLKRDGVAGEVVKGLDAGVGDVSSLFRLTWITSLPNCQRLWTRRRYMVSRLTRDRLSLRSWSTLLPVSRRSWGSTAGGGCGFARW